MTGKILRSTEETRVLVVEDEKRLRELLVSTIPDMGFQARGVAAAREALKIMENDAPDIVVLDLYLPDISGLKLLEILHDRWPNTQVIILTGFGDLEAAKQAIRLDVVDFLTKPASLGEVEIALDRARRRQMQSSEPHLDAMAPPAAKVAEGQDDAPHRLRELERDIILAALARNGGNRAATAEELGISQRTLYYRLAEYQRQDFNT